MDIRKFQKKNLNYFHVIGMMLGVGLSMIYWEKSGRYSDYFLKSNPLLMAVWGLLIGYISSDLAFNAKNRKDND